MRFKARRAYVPGLAALLVAAVAGCSAGSGDDSSAGDSKPGETTSATAAQPGKYRTLREACGSVPRSTLKDLLPGAASLPEDQQEKAYQGAAAVTYDTDRRVGCSWKADSPAASNQLVIDVERVVSYDPAVSDDTRAQEVYAKKEAGANIAPATPSASSSGSPDASGSPGASDAPGASDSAADPGPQTVSPSATASGTASTSASAGATATATEGLEPRVLDDLGDAAFLDDVLARSGSAAQHRTVSVVFRTSNVIVTVRYTEQPALSTEVPDSKELQDKARGLARTLVDQLNE
ncbi:DUF3558 domain-containing protein [Streptomyces sp. NPDC101062]|uniref:DUF3558 domain-containing protein n=1 Tax=unclassified Streptomyces TaxID=2593676 RepID=UPI002E76AE6E|nr:DUF3558 domain-containing protein [Streptomyces sp. JV176]MEE1798203.1 DUF3558 domain-containing protein [Streptomyces sp. JV176]